MYFNNLKIADNLQGFRVIKVNGRETISNNLLKETTHEGEITLENHLPAREIVVTYTLKRSSTTELQTAFKKLRQFLTTDREVPIRFEDEPNTIYFGRLNTFGDIPDESFTVVSTFTIHCDSPYKFSNSVNTTGLVTVDTFYETLPEKIRLTTANTLNKIEITNQDYKISATGTFNTGSVIEIIFSKEEVVMTVNGIEATYMLDLQSDLENFYLKKGDAVVSSNGTIILEMRERWL